MRVSLITKAASLFGAVAVAVAGGGLLFAGTARAEEGRTFDCQMVYVFGNGSSVEGYDCGEPLTYDGPGKVRYFNGSSGWTCTNISVRPESEGGTEAVSVLKASGCTSDNYPGHILP
ncbi:hypothetical protein MUK60_02690 [Streptomyces sp. LRE541]|uniref:hypothetical protein n=1 Tax=Streptomyces sp. LRE541 TaxID=2931983 RepID=UPI00200E40A6|nr:hypothetical protein [Streptomyces sp. LRE541]UPZ26810.1 hypothetical protein MUK60_02690 [Streptomyces sp. LRE541]